MTIDTSVNLGYPTGVDCDNPPMTPGVWLSFEGTGSALELTVCVDDDDEHFSAPAAIPMTMAVYASTDGSPCGGICDTSVAAVAAPCASLSLSTAAGLAYSVAVSAPGATHLTARLQSDGASCLAPAFLTEVIISLGGGCVAPRPCRYRPHTHPPPPPLLPCTAFRFRRR